MITVVFVFAAVPSWVLVDALEQYRRFFIAADSRPVKSRPSARPPHPVGRADAADIHFVEFGLDADSAKGVGLAASFNGWRAGALPLSREKGGWRVVVPLPPGTYTYAFEVDGTWTTDPKAPAGGEHLGRKVSLRKVP